MRALLLLVAALTLTACAAAQPGSTGGASTPSPVESAAGTDESDLVVEIDRGDGTAPARYTLNCADVAASDHPDAQAACDHLVAMDQPFAPLPADAICAQVFDGPETARVTGRWQGEPVDLELARNDSCRTGQWDGLGPLLPS